MKKFREHVRSEAAFQDSDVSMHMRRKYKNIEGASGLYGMYFKGQKRFTVLRALWHLLQRPGEEQPLKDELVELPELPGIYNAFANVPFLVVATGARAIKPSRSTIACTRDATLESLTKRQVWRSVRNIR